MRVLLLLSVFVLTVLVSAEMRFRPQDNKHHLYKSCGEYLSRRVAFLCNGARLREDVFNMLDCCYIGCSDKQLFSWCDFR